MGIHLKQGIRSLLTPLRAFPPTLSSFKVIFTLLTLCISIYILDSYVYFPLKKSCWDFEWEYIELIH